MSLTYYYRAYEYDQFFGLYMTGDQPNPENTCEFNKGDDDSMPYDQDNWGPGHPDDTLEFNGDDSTGGTNINTLSGGTSPMVDVLTHRTYTFEGPTYIELKIKDNEQANYEIYAIKLIYNNDYCDFASDWHSSNGVEFNTSSVQIPIQRLDETTNQTIGLTNINILVRTSPLDGSGGYGDPHIRRLDGMTYTLPHATGRFVFVENDKVRVEVDIELYDNHPKREYKNFSFFGKVDVIDKESGDRCNVDVFGRDNGVGSGNMGCLKVLTRDEILEGVPNSEKLSKALALDDDAVVRVINCRDSLYFWCIHYPNKMSTLSEIYLDGETNKKMCDGSDVRGLLMSDWKKYREHRIE